MPATCVPWTKLPTKPSESLRALAQRTFQNLPRGLSASGGADVKTGRMELYVGDLEGVKAEIAAGRLKLDPRVDLTGPRPPVYAAPPPPPPGAGSAVRGFPRCRDGPGIELLSLSVSPVHPVNGCLRLENDPQAPVVVWPRDAALDLTTRPGEVRVLDRRSGRSFRAGEKVAFTGPFFPLKEEAQLAEPTPGCPGP